MGRGIEDFLVWGGGFPICFWEQRDLVGGWGGGLQLGPQLPWEAGAGHWLGERDLQPTTGPGEAKGFNNLWGRGERFSIYPAKKVD